MNGTERKLTSIVNQLLREAIPSPDRELPPATYTQEEKENEYAFAQKTQVYVYVYAGCMRE